MRAFYRHTQIGGLLRLSVLVGAFGMLAAAFALKREAAAALIPLAIILCGVGWIFTSLTVEVTPTELKWFFGPGVWRKSVARGEIVSATLEKNQWWWGWGIHRTPRGWLYNVAGLAAVEIALCNGRTLRIGSDEAEALAAALRSPGTAPKEESWS